MTSNIVVVGSLNMDFVVMVNHLPAPGETVLGRDFQMIPGGKGANQACAAGKLGSGVVATRMLGRVGYDVFADHLKASLAAAGVDVSAVHATRSQPTGVALIWVDKNGQNSIVVASGANHSLTASEIHGHRASFRQAGLALFQLETPLDAVAAALALAREEGARTMLDPAPAQPLRRDLLERVDILTPNESEACILLGLKSLGEPGEMARQLKALGPRGVLLKLGSQGVVVLGSDENPIAIPAHKVSVADTTAAGDAFNGAFAVALSEGKTPEQAARFAVAAAAISVTRHGAQPAMASRAEIDALMRSSP
jgi:ribokinase